MMTYRALLLLPLLCVGATAPKRIIHRIVEEKTWYQAQDFCRQNHRDLLTIKNQTDNENIPDDGWIGLFRDFGRSPWKWSSGDVNVWTNGIRVEYFKKCAYKTAGNTWLSKDCFGDTFPFYCMDEFVLVEEQKPWEEALEHCRRLPQLHPTVYGNHQYDLASPLTLNNVNAQDIFPADANKVWIGLRYMGDQWYWLSGQHHDHFECSSTHRCGTLEYNGTLYVARERCNETLPFLCGRKFNT